LGNTLSLGYRALAVLVFSLSPSVVTTDHSRARRHPAGLEPRVGGGTIMTDVIGAIAQKWNALGGAGGFGQPEDIERPTFDGVGRAQPFAGGKFIVWRPQLGAFEVHGGIAAKWLALGREQFGYPRSDEHDSSVPGGRRSDFEHGFIDWTRQHGAIVHGPVPID